MNNFLFGWINKVKLDEWVYISYRVAVSWNGLDRFILPRDSSSVITHVAGKNWFNAGAS